MKRLQMMGVAVLLAMSATPVLAEGEEAAAAPPTVEVSGRGPTATNPVTLPAAISIARITHQGKDNFIVKTFIGAKRDLLVNEIGNYSGARPVISVDQPVTFDVDADGPWSIILEPIGTQEFAHMTGKGDDVSRIFPAPAVGPWEFKHDGTDNYIVKLHCSNGSTLVQNRIGVFNGSTVLQPRGERCFWEVEADGNWSQNPR